MEYDVINYEVEDNIHNHLNRPEKLNALNETMSSEILNALDRADSDDNVKVNIFTGKGRVAPVLIFGRNTTFDYDLTVEDPPDGGGVPTLRIQCINQLLALNGPAGRLRTMYVTDIRSSKTRSMIRLFKKRYRPGGL